MLVWLLAVVAATGVLAQDQYSWPWFFSPASGQCGTSSVYIGGGQGPWTLVVAPIWGNTFVYTIQQTSATISGTSPLRADFVLPFKSGTYYTAYIIDRGTDHFNSFPRNPWPLQTMGTGTTTCQTSAESQAEPLEFYFDLYGSTSQCGGNFVLEWNDIVGVSEWFATIVPLDGSYQPQDIVLPSRSGSFSLTLDYAVGTKFTVLFSNGNGIGRGGVGGIYQVTSGSTVCVTETRNTFQYTSPLAPTDSVPVLPTSLSPLTTTAMPTTIGNYVLDATVTAYSIPGASSSGPSSSGSSPTPYPSSSSRSSTSSSSWSFTSTGPGPSQPSNLSPAVIGGAAGGGVVALIAMASLLIFCCVRSRRRSRAAQIDLIGGGGEDVEYKPYPMAPTGGLYDQTHQYSEEQYVQPYTHANATGSTGSKVELPVASQTSAAPAPSPTTANRNPVWGDLTVEDMNQQGGSHPTSNSPTPSFPIDSKRAAQRNNRQSLPPTSPSLASTLRGAPGPSSGSSRLVPHHPSGSASGAAPACSSAGDYGPLKPLSGSTNLPSNMTVSQTAPEAGAATQEMPPPLYSEMPDGG
ncbi:hypothetical protein EHS25_007432 [Saitozyma podzolica]|uniref:Mid2 domain-containing protein n=1 Tax=Saitozyma podzolica TaxID=1890683 RepID=A0A427YPT1_9TREE|nr:hypothetical protein EHS25_007432 [Saitozyma podzolica]